VVNADVEIKDNFKETTQSTKSDRGGVYRFFFLAPGRYTLKVTHQGFRTESRTVNVLLGPPVTVNLSMTIAETSSEITVAAEAPLVQAENGDVSTTMSQQQVSEVPNPGGDITCIAQIAPGVIMNTDISGLANFSSLGMPGTSNIFTLDGMSENDNGLNLNLAGSLQMLLGQNQIPEVTVVGIGYSGQFGGAAGANINFVTKSAETSFTVTPFTTGTAQCSTRTIGSVMQTMTAALSTSPINGPVLWAARSRRKSCSSSSTAKELDSHFRRISTLTFRAPSLKQQPWPISIQCLVQPLNRIPFTNGSLIFITRRRGRMAVGEAKVQIVTLTDRFGDLAQHICSTKPRLPSETCAFNRSGRARGLCCVNASCRVGRILQSHLYWQCRSRCGRPKCSKLIPRSFQMDLAKPN
jgi:Carboxypeptidase regulatory-like domain